MRDLEVWITRVFVFATVSVLSLGSPNTPETCEASSGTSRRSPQCSQDATSLLQVRQATSQRSLSNAKRYNVPKFKINLDDPPRKRWVEVTKYYRTEMIAMQPLLMMLLNEWSPEQLKEWRLNSGIYQYPEYIEEYKGVVETLNHPSADLDSQILFNLLYEMSSPILCSAVLWAQPNGTVIHGRNMDYNNLFFTMPDGTTKGWNDITYEAHFYKGGKPLFVATNWPSAGGIHTGMRFDGWSFEQQTRVPDARSNAKMNLEASKKGGISFMYGMRHIMETTPDFQTAVKKIQETKWMAPQYFILAGAKPWEGVVLSIDRNWPTNPNHFTPTPQYLSKSRWYIVQTNDDLGTHGKDARRAVATGLIKTLPQTWMNVTNMMGFMHTPLLFIPNENVFAATMVPNSGYYATTLHDQPPGKIAGRGWQDLISSLKAEWR